MMGGQVHEAEHRVGLVGLEAGIGQHPSLAGSCLLIVADLEVTTESATKMRSRGFGVALRPRRS